MEAPHGRLPIDELAGYDTPVRYRGLDLRLIISRVPQGKEKPWFMLTNIFDMNRLNLLLRRYRARWEIETFFKDLKWTQDLKHMRIRSLQNFTNVLIFMAFGWFIAYRLAYVLAGGLRAMRKRSKVHPKKQLSWFNQVFKYYLKPVGYYFRLQNAPPSPTL